MEKIRFIINSEYDGKTIKEFLKDNNIGRGKVESIRVNKEAMLNDNVCSLETKMKENDVLSFLIDEQIDFVCSSKSVEVVYEDDYMLIVNKPANMIIHPDDKSKDGTLVNLVARYYKDNNINRKIRYVHRIDKETTGLVIFAKDFISEARLLKDIESHVLERKYIAIVEGTLDKKQGTINLRIGQDRHKNGKMCVSTNGKEAITDYKVIKEFKDYSIIGLRLKTGRTHQIRVHLSYIGHPLLADVLYGGNTQYINRVALHSFEVIFTHPITKMLHKVNIGLPNDMKKLNLK